jgi:hypothetical protein
VEYEVIEVNIMDSLGQICYFSLSSPYLVDKMRRTLLFSENTAADAVCPYVLERTFLPVVNKRDKIT